MNTTPKLNTSMHEYINLFIEERAYVPGKEPDLFVTWCVGPVKDGIFYGLQVSCSDLLPDHTEAVAVDLNECQLLASMSNGMPDYFFELEMDQLPRESKKLQFKLREGLPMDVRLKLIQAQDAHRNQLYAFK